MAVADDSCRLADGRRKNFRRNVSVPDQRFLKITAAVGFAAETRNKKTQDNILIQETV